MVPVQGAPFSAEQVTTGTRVFADGTRQPQGEGRIKIYRDFEGHERIDRGDSTGPPGRPIPPRLRIAEVRDPVAGQQYILDLVNHVAHRFALQVMTQKSYEDAAAARAAAEDPPPVRPGTKRQSLGTKNFGGEPATGVLFTNVYPAGARGNDQQVTVLNENWTSQYLRRPVYTKLTSPFPPIQGERVMQLINISHLDPDPALFAVPSGYSVVDETGPFKIIFPAQQ
jgi:hypothetical protein